MQIFTIFLLIVLAICQWGYAETIPSTSGAEGGPASTEVEDFVAKPVEEIEELFHQKQYQIVIKECERLIAYDSCALGITLGTPKVKRMLYCARTA